MRPPLPRALKVCADFAMFGNRTDEAVQRYRRLAASLRTAGRPVPALLFEVVAAHSLVNGGRTAPAAALVANVAPQAMSTGNPTLMCWTRLVGGMVVEQAEPERALAAYAEAVQHGAAADSALFVTMAQVSAATATARLSLKSALASFEQTLDQWSRPGTEMLQWWLLGQPGRPARRRRRGPRRRNARRCRTAGERPPQLRGRSRAPCRGAGRPPGLARR